MNPKLHKSKELNEMMENQNSEYINITENLQIEGRPIVAGPVYYTSGISQMLHLILEPSLSFIPHILKDSWFSRTLRYNMHWRHLIEFMRY